jgi:hypothetical protein
LGDGGGAGGASGAGGSSGEGGSSGSGGGTPGFDEEPGLPDTPPWGPSFIGIADDMNQDGMNDDLAFGIVWDPEQVWALHEDDHCLGFGTLEGGVPGSDPGTITVTGGSGVASVDLTRNDSGYYFLEGDVEAWSAGDLLSITAEGFQAGPVQVPTGFSSDGLAGATASRSAPLTVAFEGSDAEHVVLSLSGGGDGVSYLLACLFDAAGGTLTVPVDAIESIPESVTDIGIKLSPVNWTSAGDVALIVTGDASEVNLALE